MKGLISMRKTKVLGSALVATLTACTILPPKRGDAPHGPGGPSQSTAPTIGQVTGANTPPPTPTGAIPPTAVIVAPSVVTKLDSFLLSGAGSSPGSGTTLTYAWTL